MFDVATKVEEAVAIAALTQAIVVKLHRLYHRQHGLAAVPPRLDRGKQVARGALRHRRQVDRFRQRKRKCRCASWSWRLLEFVDDVLDDLGSRSAVEYVHTNLKRRHERRTPVARLQQTGDLKDVVRHLVEETRAAPVPELQRRTPAIDRAAPDACDRSNLQDSTKERTP